MSTSAPLSSSLFMIIRELPTYLSTAHALRYKDVEKETNLVMRICQVVCQYLKLIKEIVCYKPSRESFERNINRLDEDFATINNGLNAGTKPICAYFVSNRDHSGAILGDHLYYYHHYKIQQFQKYYDVAAKVIRDNKEIPELLKSLKSQHPNREVKVIDIVSHGTPYMLAIPAPRLQVPFEDGNEFSDCAKDAVIILDACSTGMGENSIAESIAKKNAGKTVMAPGCDLFFSKPVFEQQEQAVKINHVVHGFAVFNAYTSKQFRFPIT